MSLIVFPAACVRCACGERLAPHPTAAHRMGLAQLLRHVDRCACGAMVLREKRRAAAHHEFPPRTCNACHDAEASTLVEHEPGSWSEWCAVCVENREAALAERFIALTDGSK